VIFPGGSRSGVVSVTVVHNDKVPMVPNFGQQPRLIVTIQPAGARFDPPARLTLPNVEGLAPGAVTEMYSFDHDLGHFVSIGPATVSEDGSAIVSNLGVGVLKAGWHCCGDPAAGGTPEHCADCQKCVGVKCVPDDKAFCKSCATGKGCDGEGLCKTGKELIPKICRQIKLDDAKAPRFCPAGRCGAGITRTISRVVHSCDHVDLGGSKLTERISVVSKGCLQSEEIIGLGCLVPSGNSFTDCSDRISMCVSPEVLAVGECKQIYTQEIHLDECLVETNTITFTLTKSATSCFGTTDFVTK
jgi:hypothetical protein